jgi:uncharacterized protein (TIGR00251 family)
MRITVRVRPGARRDAVGGRYGLDEPPVLVVRVRAPAVDGKANAAVVEALAAAFGVHRRAVRIVAGTTSRSKIVEVDGGRDEALSVLLAAEADPASG